MTPVRRGGTSDRVLVVGLDGATFDLLLPWLEEGFLPHIAGIWSRGAYGPLRSTIPPITASAWASFQTGMNPGKHGLFDFTEYRPGSYETPFVNAQSIKAEPLWGLLSRHGKRVVVINCPMTYPPRPVNGVLISGLLTPSTKVEFTHPPGLYQELIGEIGDYKIFVPTRALQHLGLRAFVDRLRYASRKRAEAARFLMGRIDWDFFMVHFHSPDVLQHALWSHLDPCHPAYKAAHPSDREYVRQFYRELDALIGGLVEQAGEDVTTILMSDHGFGPAKERFHINQWLATEGYLTLRAGSLHRRFVDGAEDIMRRMDFLKLRRRLIPPFSKREVLVRRLTQESLIDWTASRAFALPSSAAIRLQINLRGREPSGVVEGGREYEHLRDEIAQRLLRIRDPETGGPVVEHVFRREEIYSGPALDSMPDLVAQPVGGYQIATRFKESLLFSPLAEGFTGNHRMDGVLIMVGYPVAPGQAIQGAGIADLFPTILYLLDVPLPPNLDGEVLIQALKTNYVRSRPIRRRAEGPSPPGQTSGEGTYSSEDAMEIRDRLQGLGYID